MGPSSNLGKLTLEQAFDAGIFESILWYDLARPGREEFQLLPKQQTEVDSGFPDLLSEQLKRVVRGGRSPTDVPKRLRVRSENIVGWMIGNSLSDAVEHGGPVPTCGCLWSSTTRPSSCASPPTARRSAPGTTATCSSRRRAALATTTTASIVDVLCNQTGGDVELIETGSTAPFSRCHCRTRPTSSWQSPSSTGAGG